MENFKLKMTKNGLQIEKRSNVRPYEKQKAKKPVVKAQTKEQVKEEPKGKGFSDEKKALLRMGGWDETDVQRMESNAGKRISTDEGYVRI